MATFTQTNRLIAVTTALGKDVLLLTAFSGREELSRCFRYDLEMLSENTGLAARDIVGKAVTWTVGRQDQRPFNGVVSRFAAGELAGAGMRMYRAEVVPWLWLLTRTADCRIFQNKSSPEIIEQIFKDLGFSAYRLTLKGPYPKRDYCVQYRETDFDFVSRLMEQEGIFYFFQHEPGKHTLVLADQKSAYRDCPEKEVVHSTGSLIPNHITRWNHEYEFRSGKHAQTDYNFETPAIDLMTQSTTTVPLPDNKKYEVYDYPGAYGVKAVGGERTRVRMEEDEVGYEVVRGASTCVTFTPGGKFTLKAHECQSEAGKGYAITAIEHAGQDRSYLGGGGEGYGNTFTCIPDSVVFRPARLTPRPVVQGPQPAVVVGPKNEEIYTDKYGRVKVQFFWDREGKKNENSSCWLRVAQGWAGKSWGMFFLPRIGQEVLVDFLEGDPDRPIVTGCVYNAEQMPPYELPKYQSQSVLKTRSTKGGTAENFNELRFEDKKGSEDVYFHAEKDFHRVVENDDDLKVGHDQTIEIKNKRTATVKEGDDKLTVKQGNREVIIEMKDDTLTIKQGNQTTKIEVGKSATEAGQSIELKVGENSIKIDQTGVTISGLKITLSGTAMVQVQAPIIKLG